MQQKADVDATAAAAESPYAVSAVEAQVRSHSRLYRCKDSAETVVVQRASALVRVCFESYCSRVQA